MAPYRLAHMTAEEMSYCRRISVLRALEWKILARALPLLILQLDGIGRKKELPAGEETAGLSDACLALSATFTS